MYPAMVVIVVGVVSLLAGIGVGIWFGRQRQAVESAKAEVVQEQFDEYREQVNQHFENTAQHFASIGKEYQALYRHMSSGADLLLGEDSDVRRTGFPVLPAATDIAANVIADEPSDQPDAAEADGSSTDTTHPEPKQDSAGASNDSNDVADSADDPGGDDPAPEETDAAPEPKTEQAEEPGGEPGNDDTADKKPASP